MPNMANLISKHSKTVIKSKASFSNTTPQCRCKVKASCLSKGKYREKCIIYKATLTCDDNTKHHFCRCETEFKAVSIITTRVSNISEKSMLPSSRRHSGVTIAMGKALNHWENCNVFYPFPTRDKGLHAVPHIEVRNSPSIPHYIVEQEGRTDEKMPLY